MAGRVHSCTTIAIKLHRRLNRRRLRSDKNDSVAEYARYLRVKRSLKLYTQTYRHCRIRKIEAIAMTNIKPRHGTHFILLLLEIALATSAR